MTLKLLIVILYLEAVIINDAVSFRNESVCYLSGSISIF